MKINIKKYSMEQYLFYLLIIFTFGVISSKTLFFYNTNVYVEISAIFSIFFILFKLTNLNKEKEKYINFIKENKYFSILIFLFCLLSIINAMIIEPKGILYSINKIIPFIMFFFIMIYLKNEKIYMLKKYIIFSAYIFSISFILAIIMYSFKYTNGALSIEKGLNLVSFKESLDLFGEVRLYWILSHKSRFVIYCTIGLIFIVKSNIKFKEVAIFLSFICVILSNSMTGIMMYICVALYYILKKYNIFYKLKHNKQLLIILFLSSIVIIALIIFTLATKRDLSTLGSRTFIWKAGIEKIIENPMGLIYMPDNLWIKTIHNGNTFYFSNAHNGYLNELIENGAVVGVIYILLNINIFIKYLKVKDADFAINLFLIIFIFNNLESINVREMNYILFLSYSILYVFAKNKNIKRGLINE